MSAAEAAGPTRTTTRPTSRNGRRATRRTAGPPVPADPAPSVADSDPGNGDTNVDRNANLRVTFSEPVTADDAAFSLTCGSAIALAVTRESPTVYVLDPATALPEGASCTLRVEGDNYRDDDAHDPPDTGSDYTATFTTPALAGLRIHDIQGAAHLSPYNNNIVAGVPGVVTATRFNGFYIQDPQPDRDERTSEGIFIFTGTGLTLPAGVAVGARGDRERPRDRVPRGLHAVVHAAGLPERELRLVRLLQPHDHGDRPRDGHARAGPGRSRRPWSAAAAARSPTR